MIKIKTIIGLVVASSLSLCAANIYKNASTETDIKELSDFYKQYSEDVKTLDNKNKENSNEIENTKLKLIESEAESKLSHKQKMWQIEKDNKLLIRDKKNYTTDVKIEDLKDKIKFAEIRKQLNDIQLANDEKLRLDTEEQLSKFPYVFVNAMTIRGKKIAIVQTVLFDDKDKSESFNIRKNDYLHGYKIKKIHTTGLILTKDGEEYILNTKNIIKL